MNDERFITRLLQPVAGAPAVWPVMKQQLSALIVRVRVHLQDVLAGPGPWLTPSAVEEQAASASSPEPRVWLSPCRLP
jgi:hypothetical protein